MQQTEQYLITYFDFSERLITPNELAELWKRCAYPAYIKYHICIEAVMSTAVVSSAKEKSKPYGLVISCTRNPNEIKDERLYRKTLGEILGLLTVELGSKSYHIEMVYTYFSDFIK